MINGTTHQSGAQKAPDAVDLALAGVERALAHDVAAPADLLAELATQLRAVEAALAPRRKAKATKAAEVGLIAAREALKTKGLGALDEVRRAATEYRKAYGLPPPVKPRRRFGLAAALEDRPPPKSVCRKLEWEVGRVPMLVGTPGAGKSFAVQAAALDLVGGRPLWGCPDFRTPGPCRVLHVDLDQGAQKTLRRYKRLLRGIGVKALDEAGARREIADICECAVRDLGAFDVDEGEGLALGSLQADELARWRAAWIEACRGYDVAFVDSLRRLAPFLDENDSRFSVVPDTLRTVSEAAQCVIVLLHHASNKRQGPGPKQPAGTRGSSAIDGAAGTQLVIEEDGDARRVTQTRAGEAAKLRPFYLRFDDDDVAGPNGIRGIRVVHMTREEAKAPEKEAKASKLRAVKDRALKHIREINLRKGYGPLRKQVVAAVEGNDKALYVALDELVQEKLVLEVPDKKRRVGLWAADVPRPDAASSSAPGDA